MKKIIIDGAVFKKKSDLREEMRKIFKSNSWDGTNSDEFVDKVSGFSQVAHFKSADDSATQFLLVIQNSDALFENSPHTFRWLMQRIMKVNRAFKQRLNVDEALISMKLL